VLFTCRESFFGTSKAENRARKATEGAEVKLKFMTRLAMQKRVAYMLGKREFPHTHTSTQSLSAINQLNQMKQCLQEEEEKVNGECLR